MVEGLSESTNATLQHVLLLQERALRLERARVEAENQMLHRIGSAHRCGEITDDDLQALWEQYRATGITGRSKRWNANIDIAWVEMQRRLSTAFHAERRARISTPNGPEGSWVGVWPRGSNDPSPEIGVSVVYVLFDELNEPFYVGSTNGFRSRLAVHVKDGKPVARWQAHPCRDRDHAYQVETRLLKEHKPRMNQKAGR